MLKSLSEGLTLTSLLSRSGHMQQTTSVIFLSLIQFHCLGKIAGVNIVD